MGTLRKAVILTEGAKPGIPQIKVEKIDHGTVDLTIQVFNRTIRKQNMLNDIFIMKI